MSARDILLTGFPSNELARRVLSGLLDRHPEARITCLVPERFMERAHTVLDRDTAERRARVELLSGDVAAIDLGLSGAEYLELASRVEIVHHCAAVTYTAAPLRMAERVNIGGANEIVELARVCKRLVRVVHWSTTAASGERGGVVREDDLIEPRGSRRIQTRYRAERIMTRARREVPVTIVRTAMLAGDSKTGMLSRVEGAHLLISGLLSAPRDMPIPRLGSGDSLLQVVPIDYAVEAGLTIASAPDTLSRTFHVVDPSPPTLDQALAMVASHVGRPPPRGGLPGTLARAFVRMPLVDKLVHAERALLDELGRDVRYDDTNARAVLGRAGLTCPPFSSYVGKLVDGLRRERKSDRPPQAAPTSA